MELVSWDDDIPTYYGKIKFKFQPMVLVYLPKWVMNWTRANVGIHIPAPWVAYGYGIVYHSSKGVVIIG